MKLYYINEKDPTFIFPDETELCPRITVIPAAAALLAGFFVYSKPTAFPSASGVNITAANLDEDIKHSKLYDSQSGCDESVAKSIYHIVFLPSK